MSKSVNKVILVGNLGKDPEIKFTGGGTAVANFSIATSSSYKDKTTQEWRETTEWHNVVAWQRLAEIARDYLKKGNKVYIEGRLQTRKWQDKEGKDRYTTEVVANELVMMGGGEKAEKSSGFDQAPARNAQNYETQEITDEDIPF